MYRDTIFMTEIYPDMYHDTVSLSVSSRLSCVLCFCGCKRASLVLFGLSNTRVSPDVFSQDSLSKSVQCRNESIGRHPLSRVVQRTLGKYAEVRSSLCWCRPGGNLALFPVLRTRLEIWYSRGMYLDLSRGMKVNEFADLTTSEFVSEYLEENPNFVWSGRKHLETHEYINEPVAFSQVMKVPPCFFVVCRLESELNCR